MALPRVRRGTTGQRAEPSKQKPARPEDAAIFYPPLGRQSQVGRLGERPVLRDKRNHPRRCRPGGGFLSLMHPSGCSARSHARVSVGNAPRLSDPMQRDGAARRGARGASCRRSLDGSFWATIQSPFDAALPRVSRSQIAEPRRSGAGGAGPPRLLTGTPLTSTLGFGTGTPASVTVAGHRAPWIHLKGCSAEAHVRRQQLRRTDPLGREGVEPPCRLAIRPPLASATQVPSSRRDHMRGSRHATHHRHAPRRRVGRGSREARS